MFTVGKVPMLAKHIWSTDPNHSFNAHHRTTTDHPVRGHRIDGRVGGDVARPGSKPLHCPDARASGPRQGNHCDGLHRLRRPDQLCLWVPAINIGSVYVVDVSTGNVHEIPVAQVPTHEGARNGVVTKDGAVYLAHSQLGQLAGLIVVSPVRTAAAAQ